MRLKQKKLFVYHKVIIVFFVLIIPVYAVNMGINYLSFSYAKEQIIDSTLSNADFYSKQLENQFDFIRIRQLDLLNDSDLQKLGFQSDSLETSEEIQIVKKINEHLLTIQNASPLIVNVGVYIDSFQKTISTGSYVTALPNREWDEIKTMMGGDSGKAVYYSEQKMILLKSSNNENLISYIELSVDRFNQMLQQLTLQNSHPGTAIIADNTPVVYDKTNLSLIQSVSNRLGTLDLLDKPVNMSIKANGQTFMATVTKLQFFDWTLCTYISEEELTGPLKKYSAWFFILSIISVVVIVIFAFSVNRMIHVPLNKLMQSFRRTEIDYLHAFNSPSNNNEFDYLYESYGNMLDKLKTSIRENYEQRIALQEFELKHLQSQINPHFLYNGFYNIYRLSKSGHHENAATLAQKLASYYRFITRSGSDQVQLQMEYQNALDYCTIQGIRFSNRIDIQCDELPEQLRHIMVPRLMIQPVIENAFEHAFEHSSKGGTLHIRVKYDDRLHITVEDSGANLEDKGIVQLQERLMDPSGNIEKTGVLNVNQRIRLKYGSNSGIFVSRSPLGGLRVEMIMDMNGGNTDV
ncbi:histidine kinase [Paenibacillus sp. LHD-117]|uniref:sensor histidine kinase n=1 Tax=Paenibacillus sp. LHD-117 TaxID=3071412 RepID=UPI0027E115FD|nr:histidine kinase [Paenibacillus sp. LHD-117]MDQ6419696.1 histidine kinase [Paenibacillus sp. LHD-117]